MLDECRDGNISDDNYNFRHGLPMATPIRFWYNRNGKDTCWHRARICSLESECKDCRDERKRRNRWLDFKE